MRRQIIVLVLAVMTLAGCSSMLPGSADPPAVSAREALPSCGSENATTQSGPWNDEGRACFLAAYRDSRPAEFMSTRLTVEGDPITTIYRVLAAGRIEIFMDTTQDGWSGGGGWLWMECRTLGTVDNGSLRMDFGPDDTCTSTPIS